MPHTTEDQADPHQAHDKIADDIGRMLELLERAMRPMDAHGSDQPNEGSCGLFGTIYAPSVSPEQQEAFRSRLAELMIEYNVDRVDVSWSVPQVVKRFARKRNGGPPPEPVGA